ncbi:unnamed protein product [Paramecium octaurelia]|uniref:Casein kinase I n=1 Tax=Paramecium octaurelia TaxID=43137 RepID=A0A8S1Y3X8_PAROT|nr:unnamed protein product [Paramecium octaurelia]
MSIIELRVCGRYKLGPKIGVGSFGQIYLAKNVQSNQDVAIKIEEVKSKHPQLLYEGKILQNLQGGVGIPSMLWCGQENDFNFLVMDLLGQNLEELLVLCKRAFTLKTVLMLADQLISNLEYIHFKNYVHRDIKPENFLMGCAKKSHIVYTIDFGLSKRYRDARTHDHIPQKEGKPLIGTARYASINTHKGTEQSRRDDLEALGYMLIYFLKGTLPWQGIRANRKEEKYQKIMEKKISTPIDQLCKGIPNEFQQFMNYVRNLKYDEKPDYSFLKKIFKERFVKEGYEYDYVYDWILIPMSTRSPFYSSKIPLTIELLQNEEKFLIKEYDKDRFGESNFSNWNMVDDLDHNQDEIDQQPDQNTKPVEQQKPKKQEVQQPVQQQKKDKDCSIF